MSARYELIGLTASPYSMKIRALLRYRRIPFDWIVEMPQLTGRKLAVSPILLPVLRHPMGRDMTDSTSIALMLEREIVNDRNVMPGGDRDFLCHLIEDMADEWLTKVMFWYRWRDESSAGFGADWIASEVSAALPGQRTDALAASLRKRQQGRMPMIGATEVNGPLLAATFRAVLGALRPAIMTDGYLFGSRPSLADFALFGQLSQLGSDPGPAAIMREDSPEVLHWLRRIDDASGVEGVWSGSLSNLEGLLRIVGGDYLPFLVANADAVAAGRELVEMDLASGRFRNTAYRWQANCLSRLRDLYASSDLDAGTREMLDRTGCTQYLE